MDDLSRQMASNAPVVRWFETYSKCSREIAEEMSRFMMERMQRNMEMWSTFAQSGHSTASFLEMQERWMSTAMRDYTDEGQKLAHMSGEILREGLASRPESGESREMDKPVAIRTRQ